VALAQPPKPIDRYPPSCRRIRAIPRDFIPPRSGRSNSIRAPCESAGPSLLIDPAGVRITSRSRHRSPRERPRPHPYTHGVPQASASNTTFRTALPRVARHNRSAAPYHVGERDIIHVAMDSPHVGSPRFSISAHKTALVLPSGPGPPMMYSSTSRYSRGGHHSHTQRVMSLALAQ